MSNTYTVYTLGGGEALAATFHMVNSILGTDNYVTAIKISAGFGLFWVLMQTAISGDYRPTAQWTMLFVVLFNVLFVPKANVVIVDRLDNGTVRAAVNNVPWGLAWFASITSEVGDVVTRTMELASSLPDDMQYHKNGLLFGSKLVEESHQVKIVDPAASRNIESFIKQCVFYDLYLGKYSIKDLLHTPNLWQFILKAKPSPIRAFTYDQEFMTCQQGAVKLDAIWTHEINRAAEHWGKRFFRRLDPKAAQAKWLAMLPGSYQYVLGIANQAGHIMQQNMMMNAFYSAVKNHNSELGADAAITNFVYTRAQAQARSAYSATARQAEKFVPLLRIAFEALYYGAFPLMLLAMMLPIGGMIAKNYFFAFVWLQSWGPLYAVLNLLMNLEARADGLAQTTIGTNEHVLTLLTQTGVESIHADISNIAGYLSISIPFIAAGITKGVGSFRHLVTSMLSIAQGAGTQAASEATTGNIRLANTSQGVHAYHSTQANRWQTSGQLDGGAMRHIGPDGEMLTQTAGGRSVLDDRTAHSQLPSAVMTGFNRLQNSFSQQSQQLQEHAAAESRQSSLAEFSAYTQSGIFDSSHSQLLQSGQTHQNSQLQQTQSEIATLQQRNQEFSETNKVNLQDSAQLLASASAGIPFEKVFNAFGVNLSADFKGMTQSQQEEIYQKAQGFTEQHQLRESAQSIMGHLVSAQSLSQSANQQALHESVKSDWTEHQAHTQSAQETYQKAHRLESLSSRYQALGLEGRSSLQQAFFDYLQTQPSPIAGMNGTGQLGERGAIALLHDPNHQDVLQGHMANFMQERFGNAVQMSDNLRAQYEQGQPVFEQSRDMQAQHQTHLNDLHQRAAENIHVPIDLSEQVSQSQVSQQQDMAGRSEGMRQEGRELKERTKEKYDELEDLNSWNVIQNGFKNTAIEPLTFIGEKINSGVDKDAEPYNIEKLKDVNTP